MKKLKENFKTKMKKLNLCNLGSWSPEVERGCLCRRFQACQRLGQITTQQHGCWKWAMFLLKINSALILQKYTVNLRFSSKLKHSSLDCSSFHSLLSLFNFFYLCWFSGWRMMLDIVVIMKNLTSGINLTMKNFKWQKIIYNS